MHTLYAKLNNHRREFVAKRLMHHAEKFKQLIEEQIRGRYGRTAGDVTVLTALTTEIFNLQRSNAAITDCNTKACYDRMLLQLVSLSAYKLGLPYNICKLYTRTLQRMECVMITGYRESAQRKSCTMETKMYRQGQGATYAPAEWTIRSSTNIKYYNKQAHGCTISNLPDTMT
eukprot:15348857-Ditylum_brightwellii.AAC.1